MQKNNKGRLFYQSVIIVIIIYSFFKWGVGYISKLIIGTPNSLPIPGAAMMMYMTVVSIGVIIYASSSEERLSDFLFPAIRLLRGEEQGIQKIIRIIVLTVFPIFIGWIVYTGGLPVSQATAGIRIQHPTLPGKYEKMINPFREPNDTLVKEFVSSQGLGNIAMDEGRKLMFDKSLSEGRALYQQNCHGCHGCGADGAGPMARGFLLRPVNFRDMGTITTIIESYAFWRIKTGAPGLPSVSSPWDSPMPRWGDELTDEQIWKIVLAIYDLADVEPRKPEKLEH